MRERALVNQVMKMVHPTRAKVATFLAAEHTELGHHFQGSRVQHNNNHTLKNHHQVTLFTHISLPLSHHQVRESVAVEKRYRERERNKHLISGLPWRTTQSSNYATQSRTATSSGMVSYSDQHSVFPLCLRCLQLSLHDSQDSRAHSQDRQQTHFLH